MLPLTETVDSKYKTYLYFTLNYSSAISKVFCSIQAVFHGSCLLSMLTLSFCILISSYFRLFKAPLNKKVEIRVCMVAWIVPLLVCLCSLLGKGEMAIDDNNLCWPKHEHWRLTYDIMFCLIYLLNLIIIVVIVVKLYRAKMQNIRKFIIRILLLGSVLITLSFYLYDLSHSLYVNFCLTFKIKTKEDLDSNNHNMWFILMSDVFGLGTGVCLMLVYKPKLPQVLCCKDNVSDQFPEIGNNNELVELAK